MRFPLFLSLPLTVLFCLPGTVPAAHADDIRAEIVDSRPLIERRRSAAILRLEHEGGFPVLEEELEAVHDRPMQLFIVDPELGDYHHVYPRSLNRPGEYVFTMMPNTPCGYRVWADIDTVNDDRQFVMADIRGAEDCGKKSVDRKASMIHESGKYKFILDLEDGGLAAGEEGTVKLTVRDVKGRYVHELEPVMGAYAQMVGFYDDYKTVAQIRPMGGEPVFHGDMGGPVLKFNFKPEREGFVKLFAKMKIHGHEIIAPFGIKVGSEMPVAGDNLSSLFGNDYEPARKEKQVPADTSNDDMDALLEWETQAIKKEKAAEHRKWQSLQQLYQGSGGGGGGGGGGGP